MTEFTWDYLDADGQTVVSDALPTKGFPTQSDAESYLGESWEELADAGVKAVTLREGETVVYGPMSLEAAE